MAFERLFGKRPAQADLAYVPTGTRIYAIGDIHGCRRQLAALHAAIAADAADGPDRRLLIYLGDYVDRGPDCSGVLEDLSGAPPADFERLGIARLALRGNHDDWFLRVIETGDPAVAQPWLTWGGVQTCLSYGIEPSALGDAPGSYDKLSQALSAAVPQQHQDFLRGLPHSYSEGDYFFCHAGVRPGIPLSQQADEDLIWIREPFLSYRRALGKIVVHGHTPSQQPEVLPHRIGVDTGACYGGVLSAVVLEEDKQRFLQAP